MSTFFMVVILNLKKKKTKKKRRQRYTTKFRFPTFIYDILLTKR